MNPCRLRDLIVAIVVPVGLSAFAAERPNVVFIVADDQAFGDYGFMGNERVHTPHIDALAARSARYVNGYVPSSVCRPSLATMLTGRYPHQHGIHFNHPPPGFRELGRLPVAAAYNAARGKAVELFSRSPALPTILADAGYTSFQAGKHWEGSFRDAGFSDGMTLNEPCVDQPWNRQLPSGEWVAHGNGDAGLVIGRKTMQPVYRFIDRNRHGPFLLWYAPVLPHEPHDAPTKYRRLFEGDADIPPHVVGYYANIAWFDETVGQLLEYIDAKRLTKNTLFVFVCDNGWTNAADSPKQNRRSKRSPFEDGIRTPILLCWDGRIKPVTHAGLVSSVDLVPTVLSALGIDPAPHALPGIDLLPSATGREPLDAGRPVFGEIYPGDASELGHPERDVAYRWVRHHQHKLIVPHAHRAGQPWNAYVRDVSLYDLQADPGETNNLAKEPAFAADVSRLWGLLDQWWPVEPDP